MGIILNESRGATSLRFGPLPPGGDALRDYQLKAIADVEAALAGGVRRVLVQAPTGAGKTHVICALTRQARNAGQSVLLLATRVRIVWQIHERLDAFGVPHGVIAAPLPQLINRNAQVQVASADTLYRRSLVDERLPLPSADVVIFDEAHLALGSSRCALLDRFPDALHLGFTATPCKISGRPLRDRFDSLIHGPSIAELIDSGALVRPRIFSAPAVTVEDLAGVDRDGTTGDYAIGQLGSLMARPKLVGDVVQNWLRLANGLRTIVFACTKSHGAALEQEFLQAGVAAELLTDQHSEPDREAAIHRLETGATTVIVNCFLLSYGLDVPVVECVVLARPTRSLVLYLQAIGRGMRPAPGKSHVVVIDHGRVVESLGMPTDDFGWTLEDVNVNASARAATAQRQLGEERTRTCAECSHIWLVSEEGPACSSCGWLPTPKARPVAVVSADLQEIDALPCGASRADLQAFYQEALGFYTGRWPDRWAQKPNGGRWWAWSQARERFGIATERMPSEFWSLAPLRAGTATSGWLRSRLIAWARRRA